MQVSVKIDLPLQAKPDSQISVLYYAPSIFAALGQSSNTTSLLATGVVGIVMFLATIPAVMYVDKLGRKPVFMVGGTGMFLCHFTIAGIFATNQHKWANNQGAGAGWVRISSRLVLLPSQWRQANFHHVLGGYRFCLAFCDQLRLFLVSSPLATTRQNYVSCGCMC